MPVLLDSHRGASRADQPDRCITIGLINNMSDEALKATERQFIALLHAASDGIPIRLFLCTLPGIARTSAVESHIRNLYTNIDDLWNGPLDGLIVTGREPLAARLQDEPYWPGFTRLLAWARENVHSTIWSCLAAHAAVLHMDGIERVRRNDKLFGVFDCDRTSSHPLTAETPQTVRLPHSRWNGIPSDQLLNCGYEILTHGADAGVDTFIKHEKKLFLFFQGHPEYALDTLSREYRRDVGRYIRHETDQYPSVPRNYFNDSTSSTLAALRIEAMTTRHRSLLPQVAAILENSVIQNGWAVGAATIYRNWLKYLCTQKEVVQQSTPANRVADLEPVS